MSEKKLAKVYYAELWGLREKKYDWLLKNDIKTTKWRKLSPKSEFYLFVPREEKLLKIFEKYAKITDIFPVNSVGIVTARDKLTIKWTPDEVWSTVLHFSKINSESARQVYNLGKDARDWKVELAQKDLKESGFHREKVVPILYRPFDIRYTYYTGKSRGFHCMPRPKVMRHMMHENLGLLTCRQQNKVGFYHALVCKNIIESCAVSNATREITYLFPLFFYQKEGNPKRRTLTNFMIFEPEVDYETRKPNLSPAIVEQLTTAFKKTPSPEQIFFYIYAVLYSNTYRTKYAEFLKIDFPRIPFTKDYKLFRKMGELGERLVNLHLLKSAELGPPIVKFPDKGDGKVKKIRYDGDRVYINEDQCFEGITKEVWQYQIGGYQVCDKWLKDRKGRGLSLDDIKHYCKIVTAITKTIEIQDTIDKVYSEIESSTEE